MTRKRVLYAPLPLSPLPFMSSLVKLVTQVLGVVLLLVGIAGFVTGDPLIAFKVDAVHNSIHILSGLVALFAASNYSYARMYLIVFGLVYAVVAILGFTMGGDIVGLFTTNAADDYLHTAIALVCLVVGFGSKKA